ncbi:MAG: type-4 uracil-DNA glycosylase [Thermofilaceae archaeon]
MCETRKSILDQIAEEVRRCTRCPLQAYRTHAVPGEGDPCTNVMLVGEAPGFNEDLQGKPFVGAAGNLLNDLLKVAGLSRQKVFITNVVKCRPPSNRDPEDSEVAACESYLLAQLKAIEPKIVVSLGRHSTRLFFQLAGLSFSSIMQVRGEVKRVIFSGNEFMLLPTLHPAAALYNPRLRSLIEDDFCFLGELIGEGRGLERWLHG